MHGTGNFDYEWLTVGNEQNNNKVNLREDTPAYVKTAGFAKILRQHTRVRDNPLWNQPLVSALNQTWHTSQPSFERVRVRLTFHFVLFFSAI